MDKSRFIKEVEDSSDFFFFIRPRRFGKSLFLSMLENYYDMNRREKFDALFGDLWIGQHPTEQRNSYAVMKLNFSKVSSNLDECEESFNAICYLAYQAFCDYYKELLPEDALNSLSKNASAVINFESIVNLCNKKGLNLYLLIDEYDNFTNTVLYNTATFPNQLLS